MTTAGALVAFALLLSSASAAVELQRHRPPPSGKGQCPKCPRDDTAPDPGNFSFYFLVRSACKDRCRMLHSSAQLILYLECIYPSRCVRNLCWFVRCHITPVIQTQDD